MLLAVWMNAVPSWKPRKFSQFLQKSAAIFLKVDIGRLSHSFCQVNATLIFLWNPDTPDAMSEPSPKCFLKNVSGFFHWSRKQHRSFTILNWFFSSENVTISYSNGQVVWFRRFCWCISVTCGWDILFFYFIILELLSFFDKVLFDTFKSVDTLKFALSCYYIAHSLHNSSLFPFWIVWWTSKRILPYTILF